MAMTLAMAAAAGALLAARPAWRLLWRTRLLFLVLILGYGYSLPGDPVAGMVWGPTHQGLVAGLEHALNLMALLLWLDVLVLSLPTADLMGGLHALANPLARLGLPVERITLRLALTLKVVERMEQGRGRPGPGGNPPARNPLATLFSPVDPAQVPDRMELALRPFRTGDSVVLGTLLLAMLWPLCRLVCHD